MAESPRRPRSVALSLLLSAVVFAAACSVRPQPAPALPKTTAERLKLDPSLSPVPFRWLGDDALLVKPDVGKRKLAALGNYLEKAASNRDQVWIAVWDDEAAWKRARDGGEEDASVLAHKRALYVKSPSQPAPVKHYTTFDKKGDIVYERDFLAYPLSDNDKE